MINRNVKFRAWDIINKEMVNLESIEFIGEVDPILGLARKPTINRGLLLGDVILLLWAGLKDKNDKDIYEGDIIATQDTYRHEVRFYDGAFVIGPMNCRLGQTISGTSIVLGNIYENPELLKG